MLKIACSCRTFVMSPLYLCLDVSTDHSLRRRVYILQSVLWSLEKVTVWYYDGYTPLCSLFLQRSRNICFFAVYFRSLCTQNRFNKSPFIFIKHFSFEDIKIYLQPVVSAIFFPRNSLCYDYLSFSMGFLFLSFYLFICIY